MLLRLADIHKSFGGVRALKGVSFDLRPGEVHALVGENGAGKSTMIKVITGAHQADQGTLEIGGTLVAEISPARAKKLGIAVIYQQPALFPDLSVAENIALGLEPTGLWRLVHWRRRHERALQLLNRIGADIDPEIEVRRLTMPEQQLVEIARALGADARILIMDEPTASLSDQEVANLFRVIRELKREGVGVVYISHRLEELPQVADRVTALRDGTLVGTRPMSEVNRGDLIKMMVGRELSAVFPKRAVPIGETVLEMRQVSCSATGIHDISLKVRAGEILGIAGLIGSGRTEMARVIFGLTPADSGAIAIRNQVVTIDSTSTAIDHGIAYVPEDRRRHGVVQEMAVRSNTTLAVFDKIATLGMIVGRRDNGLASRFVERLGVKTPSIENAVGNLSGGNQQKVALARWLAAEPLILILDEPTQGIDVGAKSEIHALMVELASQGMAIVMISSELPEILGMSDRIAVMREGTIVGTLDRAQASQEILMEIAFGHVPSTGGGR